MALRCLLNARPGKYGGSFENRTRFLRELVAGMRRDAPGLQFGVRLSDSQNGFRAIRTAVLRELRLREDTTTVEQEMIIETLRRGYRMAEVPTHEYCRRFGTSHIRVWRAAPRYVASLMRGLIGGGRRPQAAARSQAGESPLKTPSR